MKYIHAHRQKGAVLVYTAIGIIVLVGIAALALDLGRFFVLRTQMQNAVDAAALAGGAELDMQPGARRRAIDAAVNLLTHQSGYPNAGENLLEGLNVTVPAQGENPNFTFYCYIGASDTTLNASCDAASPVQDPANPGKYFASGDADAHYVRLTLNERAIDLFFLPVLNLWPYGDNIETHEAGTTATALAGRRWYICEYNPLMMCDPFEHGAAVPGVNNIRQAVAGGHFVPGDVISIKAETSVDKDWGPGDFGYLVPGAFENPENGAKALGEYLARRDRQACTPALGHIRTGNIQSFPDAALDSIFDIYGSSFNAAFSPPAPNVVNYPPWDPYNDNNNGRFTWKPWLGGHRFGNSDWDRSGYWMAYHGAPQPDVTTWTVDGKTVNWATATRWEVYRKEIADAATPAALPCSDDTPPAPFVTWGNGKNSPSPVVFDCADHNNNPLEGDKDGVLPMTWPSVSKVGPSPSYADGRPNQGHNPGDYERRLFYVAVINCDEQNIHGSQPDPVKISAIAKVFMLRDAPDPAADFTYLGEFVGLADETDDEIHYEVVLYE